MDGVLRFIFAFIITRIITNRAYKKKTLSNSGRIAAIFIGVIVTWSSFCHFTALLTFFYVSNKATKFKQDVKRSLEESFKENGQRDAIQVICNGLFAFIFCGLYLWDCGYGERPIDFYYHYRATKYSLAALASLCSACGDTLASELGGICPETTYNVTFHVTQLKKVPKGTNGGISLFGTLASAFGGLVVALSYYLTLKLSLSLSDDSIVDTTGEKHMPPQWPILLIGCFSGLFGSFMDSLLGGMFQYSGYDYEKDCIVETPGPNVKYISGKHVLNNNQVNFLATLLTAWFVPYFSWKMYKNL